MHGVAAAVASTLLFGLNAAITSAAVRRGASPGALVAVRNLVALAALAPLAGWRASPEAAALAAASALAGPGLGDYFYFRAVREAGVSSAVVVAYTYIFVAQYISYLLGLERPTAGALAGGLLAFLGVAVALGSAPRRSALASGAVASLLWGAGSVALGLASRGADVVTIAAIRSAVLAPAFAAVYRRELGRAAALAALSGLVGLVCGALCFIYAIATAGVVTTVLATAATPILAQMLDRAINGGRVTGRQAAGAVLAFLGVAVDVMTKQTGEP